MFFPHHSNTIQKVLLNTMETKGLKTLCIYIFNEFVFYHVDRLQHLRHATCTLFDLHDVDMQTTSCFFFPPQALDECSGCFIIK